MAEKRKNAKSGSLKKKMKTEEVEQEQDINEQSTKNELLEIVRRYNVKEEETKETSPFSVVKDKKENNYFIKCGPCDKRMATKMDSLVKHVTSYSHVSSL